MVITGLNSLLLSRKFTNPQKPEIRKQGAFVLSWGHMDSSNGMFIVLTSKQTRRMPRTLY